MKLRTQLLLINLASTVLLLAAVVYSYSRMFLSLKQAGLLALISVAAGFISTIAYWLMTKPIINSVERLIQFAEADDVQITAPARGTVEDSAHPTIEASGPSEVQQLTASVYQMKQRMQENLAQLEAMEQTRRELIANVSHDLRTPIASIQSFVEALEDGVIDDYETSRRYLRTIHRETGRLSALIDDLFELSKLEAGQQVFDPTLVHIDQVLLEVLESCSVKLEQKHIDVQVSVGDDVPPVMMMQDKITRVIRNLIDNAIRHSPQSGVIAIDAHRLPGGQRQAIGQASDMCPRLDSYSDGTGAFVEVCIRDEGEGVTSEDAARIFDRFYRVDKSRNRDSGGAGLGLAVARSLVELHGGKIGVRNPSERYAHSTERQVQGGEDHQANSPVLSIDPAAYSKGSEFWFTLPLHQR